MPWNDITYYPRYRTRTKVVRPAYTPITYSLDKPTSGSAGDVVVREETWDQKNGWYDWNVAMRKLRKKGATYASLSPDETRRFVRRELSRSDVGGPFLSRKGIFECEAVIHQLRHSSSPYDRFYGYTGRLYPQYSTQSELDSVVRSMSEALPASLDVGLDGWGTTAISRCAPSVPHASVFTTIGELYRDGLPSLPGMNALSKEKSFRDRAGSELLNNQFALKPFVSDLTDLYKALKETQKILSQYYRDSGRVVRRSYSPPAERTTTTTVSSNNIYPVGDAPLSSYLVARPGVRTTTTTTITDRWFSGAFTYYAKGDEDLLGRVQTQIRRWEHQYGAIPTADDLWNLMPWSWAADWVTNMGDILSNIAMYQTDGLVMHYGYVMEHKRQVRTIVLDGCLVKDGYTSKPLTTTQRIGFDSKKRRKATPFGFGLNLNEFSSRQLAILAALGMTKGGAVAR